MLGDVKEVYVVRSDSCLGMTQDWMLRVCRYILHSLSVVGVVVPLRYAPANDDQHCKTENRKHGREQI